MLDKSKIFLLWPIIVLVIVAMEYSLSRIRMQATVCTDVLPFFESKAFELPKSQEKNSIYWRLRDNILTTPNASKWIVLMENEYSPAQIEYMSRLTGWRLVVVTEARTNRTFTKENVHYVWSEEGDGRDIGYLYAIKNGADWIYDIGNGITPSDASLSLFDYTEYISGLVYDSGGSCFERKFFNPYTFYGDPNFCLKSFPIQYCQKFNVCHCCMRSCRLMRTPLVQHGLIQPDISTKFSKFAPPIALTGTFALWDTLNTLFHKQAFFALFFPTLKKRNSIFLRSFFVQKLLHILGYASAIYPIRYDLHQTQATEEKSKVENTLDFNSFVDFMIQWRCRYTRTAQCLLTLGREFRYRNFFTEEDYLQLEKWTDALVSIGYEYPLLEQDDHSRARYLDCRQAYVNLTFSPIANTMASDVELAKRKVKYLDELKNWCGSALKPNQTHLMSAKDLAISHSNNSALSSKRDTVLIVINNWPWRLSLGVLQRIHEPYFGLTIYCGTFDENGLVEEGYPPTMEGFSFVNVHPEEIVHGLYLHFCLMKVAEMRLRNVKGYFVTSDDLVFNFWHDINLDTVYHPLGIVRREKRGWYNSNAGAVALRRTVDLLTERYRNVTTVQNIRRKYEKKILTYQNTTDALDYLMARNGGEPSDFFYVPTAEIRFFSDFMQIFFEAGVFVEIAVLKYLAAIEHVVPPQEKVIARHELGSDPSALYHSGLIMLHPFKQSYLRNHTIKQRYCATVVQTFREMLLKVP